MYNQKTSKEIINFVLEVERMNNPDMNILLESNRNEFKHILENKYGIYIDNETGYIMEADASKLGGGLFSGIKNFLSGLMRSIGLGFLVDFIKTIWNFIKAHWVLISGAILVFGASKITKFGSLKKYKEMADKAKSAAEAAKMFKRSVKENNSQEAAQRGKTLFDEIRNNFNETKRDFTTGFDAAHKLFVSNLQKAKPGDNRIKTAIQAMINSYKQMGESNKKGLEFLGKVKQQLIFEHETKWAGIKTDLKKKRYEKTKLGAVDPITGKPMKPEAPAPAPSEAGPVRQPVKQLNPGNLQLQRNLQQYIDVQGKAEAKGTIANQLYNGRKLEQALNMYAQKNPNERVFVEKAKKEIYSIREELQSITNPNAKIIPAAPKQPSAWYNGYNQPGANKRPTAGAPIKI